MKRNINTLVVGAGSAGKTIVKELLFSEYVSNKPVAFVDDDATKIGTEYKGIKVVGTTIDIPRIVKELLVDEIFICMPSVEKTVINRIIS